MTLIAAIVDHDRGLFIADSLVTIGIKSPGIINRLPRFPGRPAPQDVHVSRLVRKAHSFNSHTLGLWAGSLTQARSCFEEIASLASKNPNFMVDDANQIFAKYDAQELSVILAMSRQDWSERGAMYLSMLGCDDPQPWPGLGHVVAEGSGKNAFSILIQPDGEGVYEHEALIVDAQVQSANVALALTLDAKLTSIEAVGSKHLNEHWGGSIETFVMVDGGFITPLTYPIYAHSFAFGSIKKPIVLPYAYVVTKELQGDDLYIVEHKCLNKTFKAHCIPSILERNQGDCVSKLQSVTSSKFRHQVNILHLQLDNYKYSRTLCEFSENKLRKIFRQSISVHRRGKMLEKEASRLAKIVQESAPAIFNFQSRSNARPS